MDSKDQHRDSDGSDKTLPALPRQQEQEHEEQPQQQHQDQTNLGRGHPAPTSPNQPNPNPPTIYSQPQQQPPAPILRPSSPPVSNPNSPSATIHAATGLGLRERGAVGGEREREIQFHPYQASQSQSQSYSQLSTGTENTIGSGNTSEDPYLSDSGPSRKTTFSRATGGGLVRSLASQAVGSQSPGQGGQSGQGKVRVSGATSRGGSSGSRGRGGVSANPTTVTGNSGERDRSRSRSRGTGGNLASGTGPPRPGLPKRHTASGRPVGGGMGGKASRSDAESNSDSDDGFGPGVEGYEAGMFSDVGAGGYATDTGVTTGGATGGGGADVDGGEVQDDEVPRRDRGEELVRKRAKARAKAKKEAERQRKAEETRRQNEVRRASQATSVPGSAQSQAQGLSASVGSDGFPPPPSQHLQPQSQPQEYSHHGKRATSTNLGTGIGGGGGPHGRQRDDSVSASSSASQSDPPYDFSTGAGLASAEDPFRTASEFTAIPGMESASISATPTLKPTSPVPTPGNINIPPPGTSSQQPGAIETPASPKSMKSNSTTTGRPGYFEGGRTASFAKSDVSLPGAVEEGGEGEGETDEGGDADHEDEIEDGNEDEDDIDDDDLEYTLKDRQDAINIEHPFGLRIWKPALYKKSRSVTRNAETAVHHTPSATAEHRFLIGNFIWTLVFGWWLALLCIFSSAVLWIVPWGGEKYGRVIWELGGYLFWPFGKYVEGYDAALPQEYVADGDGEWDDIPEGDEEDDEGFISGGPDGEGERDLEEEGRTWSRRRGMTAASTASTLKPGDFVGSSRQGATQSPLSSQSRAGSGAANLTPNRPGGRTASEVHFSDETRPLMDEPVRKTPSRSQPPNGYGTVAEDKKRSNSCDDDFPARSKKGSGWRVRALGRLMYWTTFYGLIAPIMLLVCGLCWGMVFTIPMAKLLWQLLTHLNNEPLALHFRSPPKYFSHRDPTDGSDPQSFMPPLQAGQRAPRHSQKTYAASRAAGRLHGPNSTILLCVYEAVGLQYYKYTVDGVNIMFILLLPVVFFVIIDDMLLRKVVEHHHVGGFPAFITGQGVVFTLALLSVIPLSYFIGMAVASISAQSSIGMGAVINATFGSIIEIILYSIALTQNKAKLVEGSIVGSLLAGVLLMPGLSMIGGAVRRKEQKFNAKSAGVTSTMLIMAIIGTLTPTLFYEIYGSFQLTCEDCPAGSTDSWQCGRCQYVHVDPVDDPFYRGTVRQLSYYCAVLLVLSYLIGLWFSLKTHASQIWQNVQPAHEQPQPRPPAPDPRNRMSIYQRINPVNVVQQLLPSHHHRQGTTASGGGQQPQQRPMSMGGPGISPSTRGAQHPRQGGEPGALALPEGLTREDVSHALQVVASTFYNSDQQQQNMQQQQGQGHQQHQGLHRQPSRLSVFGGNRDNNNNINPNAARPLSGTDAAAAPAASGGHDGGEESPAGGHDAPNWSRSKSASVLLGCTVLYAIIAEILVDCVDVLLEGSSVPEKFWGITLFALVPNTTEFMNAISFALHGNIALSMEIGSAYALQVCLLQIPALIVFTAFYSIGKEVLKGHAFTLVFPRWDLICIIFAVFLFTYVMVEARANYYRGSILVISYLVLLGGFFYAPASVDTAEDPLLAATTTAFAAPDSSSSGFSMMDQLQIGLASLFSPSRVN